MSGTKSLREALPTSNLKRIIKLDIGNTPDKRLQYAAEACGMLCFRNGFGLPDNLNDEVLTDLLRNLTAVECGRMKANHFFS